jgi:5'-methylthioadenosine phosphorylase
MADPIVYGVIGGSGLYDLPDLKNVERIAVDTPFGKPSADIVIGTLKGKRVAFLARHGEGHIYTPSTVPYRANIFALKKLGVRFVISVSACGSLRDEIEPGHFVVPSQIYDNTKSERGGRTFFESGLVAHVDVSQPYCQELGEKIYNGVAQVGGVVHRGGTFVVIEGPRFSTRGESEIYRQWGCSIIGMTSAPEAFLAREAEMAYATVAHVTDYDVWHQTEAPVTAEAVMQTLKHNVDRLRHALAAIIDSVEPDSVFSSHSALQNALVTSKDYTTPEMLRKLQPIVGRYYGG